MKKSLYCEVESVMGNVNTFLMSVSEKLQHNILLLETIWNIDERVNIKSNQKKYDKLILINFALYDQQNRFITVEHMSVWHKTPAERRLTTCKLMQVNSY